MVYNHWSSGNLLLTTHPEARYSYETYAALINAQHVQTYQLGLMNASLVRISAVRRVGKTTRFYRILESYCAVRSRPTSLMDSVDAPPCFSVP